MEHVYLEGDGKKYLWSTSYKSGPEITNAELHNKFMNCSSTITSSQSSNFDHIVFLNLFLVIKIFNHNREHL